ncbi:MAG: helix-turn-helix transcriptional regulator [Novosphingobium sp.]|uniref:helix-turn-helix domain-containing protein n=1 Tax=Novosphingobium sp. TaxID=1874826 RepID=UPI00301A03C0
MSAMECLPAAHPDGAPDRPPDRQSALAGKLTEREIEILRLLAAGHTVKSIAARLARSEASINERLRDARRKTGVGSSRELARLLDEQKIWDKIPDLASPPSSGAAPGQPASRGLTRTGGTIAMLIAMPIIAAGSLIMAADAPFRAARPQAAPAAAAVSRASPLVGRWALDVARVPAEERPRSVTISFSVAPDARWTTQVEIVNADGAAFHAASTAALDAAPVPITGNMPFIDSGSLRQPAPGTLVMTLGKDGAPVSTRVYTVSRDRRSMTETIIWAGSAMPKLETNTFRRIG